MGQRRAGWSAVVVAGLALAVGGCSDPEPGPGPERPSSSTPTATVTTQQGSGTPTVDREEALAALLERRAAAVRGRDEAAFRATLDDPASGFGLRQLEQYHALVALPLGTFRYGTPEPAPALSVERIAQLGPDAWVSRVAGRYSFAGFDTGTREFESYFTVVRRADGWRLADDADGGTQVQVWDLPRLSVVRSASTLVVGCGPASRLRPSLALGDRAVARVRVVWTPAWNARLVLVVPATAGQMALQVGQDPAGVAQVAAVTDGPFDTTGRAGADRVVVNPEAFATLEETGKEVVTTHEATHVAIRATTTRQVPLWLSEGMADYVGYRDVDATRQRIAAALLQQVRDGAGPTALPTAGDFDPGRSTIAPSYNAAWLAVCRIVDRRGVQGLVRFYLAVATAPTADAEANARAAFRSVLRTSEGAFTREWLGYLRTLAAT